MKSNACIQNDNINKKVSTFWGYDLCRLVEERFVNVDTEIINVLSDIYYSRITNFRIWLN